MAAMLGRLRLACTTLARIPTRSLSVTPALRSDIKLKDDAAKLQTIEADPLTDVSVLTGVPEEQLKTRRARIYVPTKSSMQSGTSKTKKWHIEFDTQEKWENPLMGWQSTGDPLSNMDLTFTSSEDAMVYCEKNGWDYNVDVKRAVKLRPKSYGANFHWNKRTRVSTK